VRVAYRGGSGPFELPSLTGDFTLQCVVYILSLMCGLISSTNQPSCQKKILKRLTVT